MNYSAIDLMRDDVGNMEKFRKNMAYGYNPFALMTFNLGVFPNDWTNDEIKEYQKTGIIPKAHRNP
jgi:hypothetical protein